jgi:hypothetical protein
MQYEGLCWNDVRPGSQILRERRRSVVGHCMRSQTIDIDDHQIRKVVRVCIDENKVKLEKVFERKF